MKESAGLLLFRRLADGVSVLLVHASGNYNRHAPWTVPKGEPEPGETLEETARRETREETGVIAADLEPVGSIEYRKTRKRVHCFLGEAPAEAEPQCASWEVDRAEFMPLGKARSLIHPDQLPFLDRLEEVLARRGLPSSRGRQN